MDGECFTTWFTTHLLPNIPPHSIIVMDNAPYHSMVEDKVPTLTNGGKKSEMQSWLRRHEVDFDSKMIRAELHQLIQAHKPAHPQYVIDRIAAENGHTVVRLPPYHCELNPIELMWAQVKGGVAQKNVTFTMSQIKILLEGEINLVTAENWAKACNHVKWLEDEIFDAEIKIDSSLSEMELSSFRFCPYDEDSDSSDSEDDDWPSDDSNDSDNHLLWVDFQAEIQHSGSDSEMLDDVEVPEFPQWTKNEC